MKKILIIIIAFFFSHIVSSQETINGTDNTVYGTAGIEVKPEFPVGLKEFYKFIGENFTTPTSKDFLGGKVYMTFIIEKDGSLTDIKVLRDLGFGTGEEIKRVLSLSPKWLSGEHNGQKVRCMFSLPIVFQGYVFKTADVEKKPEFPGGIEEFYRYISKNYNIPKIKQLVGKVFVAFVIEKDGSITEVKIIRDLGYGTGEEAIRVLELSPKWKAGEQNGQKVRCSFSLPIHIDSSR